MLTRINKHRDEAGFTLIELLVVVIIIGILAAIAIPVFLNQRQSAQLASVQSDLRNSAISVETYYTENQNYPADNAAFLASDVEVSPNNTLEYTLVEDTTTGVVTGYTVEGCNTAAGQGFLYDSAAGGLGETSGTCTVATDGTVSLTFPTS